MRAMITGITGMIGKHLANLLIEEGCDVAGVSRATSASRYLREKPPYKHYAGDILEPVNEFRAAIWIA